MTRTRVWLPLCALAGLLILIAAAASVVEPGAGDVVPMPELGGFGTPEPAPTQTPPVPESPPATGEPVEPWDLGPFLIALVMVGGALLGGLVILFLVLLARMLIGKLRERVVALEVEDTEATEEELSVEEVREAVRAGITDIDEGDDPRRAVIACWLRLESAAARVGSARLESDTPAELVDRLLAAHSVDDATLGALADCYRQARYSPHDITEELRSTARQALSSVDEQLTASSETPETEAVS